MLCLSDTPNPAPIYYNHRQPLTQLCSSQT